MARMGRDDWVALGVSALAADGEAAVALDAITSRAEKTKGSFYHHFDSHGDFIEAVIGLWRARYTDDVIAALRSAPDGPRHGAMSAFAAALDHRLERAVRRLAVGNEIAAAAVRRADGARIAYLKSCQADPESDAAADYALIEYSVFIGMLSLMPEAPRTGERLGALTVDMIAAHWNE